MQYNLKNPGPPPQQERKDENSSPPQPPSLPDPRVNKRQGLNTSSETGKTETMSPIQAIINQIEHSRIPQEGENQPTIGMTKGQAQEILHQPKIGMTKGLELHQGKLDVKEIKSHLPPPTIEEYINNHHPAYNASMIPPQVCMNDNECETI